VSVPLPCRPSSLPVSHATPPLFSSLMVVVASLPQPLSHLVCRPVSSTSLQTNSPSHWRRPPSTGALPHHHRFSLFDELLRLVLLSPFVCGGTPVTPLSSCRTPCGVVVNRLVGCLSRVLLIARAQKLARILRGPTGFLSSSLFVCGSYARILWILTESLYLSTLDEVAVSACQDHSASMPQI
jgi:hypothetical protein